MVPTSKSQISPIDKALSENPSSENDHLSLFLSGDVMTGRGIDQCLPASVEPTLFEWYVKNAGQYVKLTEQHSGPLPETLSYEDIWGDALTILHRTSPDAGIINLETAITTRDEPWPQKGIHYRMHPDNTALLNKAGIDVCVLGNNHVMDWGREGLLETIRTLQGNDLLVTGAGMDSESASSPAVVNTGHGRLLVFSYASVCSGVPPGWNAEGNKPGVNVLEHLGDASIDKVTRHVAGFRRQGDRVVVSIHWGGNWGYEVPLAQRQFAHGLVDAGAADIIHGHSSHHPKGIEIYKDRLILYGCGDLINDYEGISGYEKYRDDLPLLYFPNLDAQGALVSLRMHPMKIHRFRLNNATADDMEWLALTLNNACEPYGTRVEQTGNGDLQLYW